MASIQNLLRNLGKVKGDTRAQAAVAAEFLVIADPQGERLRSALDAAAILHWFDTSLLEKLLEIPPEAAEGLVRTLERTFLCRELSRRIRPTLQPPRVH